MEWKLDDSRPIWPQLKEQLIIAIVAGKYMMGGSFPTVRELAEDAGVNRNTMQRALSELENDGSRRNEQNGGGETVTTDEGLVTRMKETIAKQSIEKFIKEMAAIGYNAEDVVNMIKEREGRREMKNGSIGRIQRCQQGFRGKLALDRVSLSMGRGKVIGLFGPQRERKDNHDQIDERSYKTNKRGYLYRW